MQEKKKIIVTGGLGYIGSHTVIKLIDSGYHPIILDNLSRSHASVFDSICKIANYKPCFHLIDLRDLEELNSLVLNDVFGVIHFAGFKSVKESMKNSTLYFNNNVCSTINLLNFMEKNKINRFVFSSSATVYGQPNLFPVSEETDRKEPVNPYGRTKYICEDIIKSYSDFNNLASISLRYFNPIGAHPSGLIYDNPSGTPENLMPYIQRVIEGKYDYLTIFGNDYNTVDGTCVRDYIDVNDLAQAHINALESCEENVYKVYNIGSGSGYSVLQLIQAFEKLGKKVPYLIGERRKGDVEKIYADISKAKHELGWEPKISLHESVNSILKINNS